MDLLATLSAQLEQLRKQAEKIDSLQDKGPPQDWFDSHLFSFHSPNLADYVAEAQRNLNHLRQAKLSTASKQRLVQHLSEQTTALTRAFRNVDIRQKQHHKTLPPKALIRKVTVSSQQLYQRLSEIQDFERRLLDMIAIAGKDNSPDTVQRTLALHARLGRCRQALSEVEQQIQDLEKRN